MPEYYVVESCMHTVATNKNELFSSYDVMRNAFFVGKGQTTVIDSDGFEQEVTQLDSYLEFTRVLGTSSTVFKTCYSNVDHMIYTFWLFLKHYESVSNYMINLLPNILAYALFFNQWSERIEELDEMGEYMELYYVYAVICRKIFLYDYLPDQLNEDLEPIEFMSSDFRLNAVLPKHLSEN